MRTIYQTQLPHKIIREIEEDATLFISARFNEKAHIAAEPSDLLSVVRFHKENFKAKTHVLAETKADATAAIEAYSDFTYAGESYTISDYKADQLHLLKLKFSTNSSADSIARSYIASAIRKNGVRTSAEQINAKLGETGAELSDYIYTQAQRTYDNITAKTKSILSVTSTDGIDVRRITSKDDISVDEILGGGIFINRAVTGFGKTEKAVEALIRGGRGLYVAHRRSIARSNAPFAQHYESIKPGSEAEIRTLKTVVNSIAKPQVQEFIHCSKLDVLVIDEAAQTLRHIAKGSFDGKNDRVTAYEKLKEAVKKARVVYVADADTSDFVIDFIRSARKDLHGNEKIVMFESARELGVEAVIEDFEEAQAAAVHTIYNGRAFVACDNKAFVRKHVAKARKEGIEGVLGLTADNIEDYQSLIANPDELREYSSFMFSPAITSSVSILNGGYTGHYGLFSGVITSGDAVQMLRRERTARAFTVAAKPNDEVFLDNASEILARNDGISSEFDMFAARIEADDNFIRNNITTTIATALELAGFKVTVGNLSNEKQKEEARSINASATQIESAEYKEELLNAVPATRADIRNAKENGESTAETAIQVERAKLEKATGKTDITMSDVKAWKRGALAQQVKNVELARMTEQQANVKTYNEKKKIRAARDRFDYASHREALALVLATLNIDPQTLEGSFTTQDADKLGEILHASRESFNRLTLRKKLRKQKPASFTRTAKDILKEMGLDTDKGRTTRDGDRMTNTYSVTSESAQRMVQYLANRAAQNLTI
ncbi:hypothetical protein HNO53_13090 [Billgrantia antri]|uniref:Replication origin-binding protein domain-containing protein n=1 Tax=Halomonas sulfidivorans TaxID=2733488 RepID=A0ABX7WGN5_9GAMM|nr:DEAD/DEAH box helicase family protein [Halomonas sulfidivorans]QTP59571.1 hypothetical protein HNO53_13090 [Halomonas sulfidivorans]